MFSLVHYNVKIWKLDHDVLILNLCFPWFSSIMKTNHEFNWNVNFTLNCATVQVIDEKQKYFLKPGNMFTADQLHICLSHLKSNHIWSAFNAPQQPIQTHITVDQLGLYNAHQVCPGTMGIGPTAKWLSLVSVTNSESTDNVKRPPASSQVTDSMDRVIHSFRVYINIFLCRY